MLGMNVPILLLLTVLLAGSAALAEAHGIKEEKDASVPPAFDIIGAEATTDGRLATFSMEVTGEAGSLIPEKTGNLEGANVDAYVWPTKLDPSAVGFEEGSGILALAITAHPDFDDTPLYDENGDRDPANDGAGWHSHWVVLGEDALPWRSEGPGRFARAGSLAGHRAGPAARARQPWHEPADQGQ